MMTRVTAVILISILSLAVLAAGLCGCASKEDTADETEAVTFIRDVPLRDPGKIYIFGNSLYAVDNDSGPDLIAVDIDVPREPRVTKRIDNVFPEPSKTSILKIILLAPLWILAAGLGGGDEEAAEPSVGVGGSQARFTIVDHCLYVIAGSSRGM